MLKDLNVDIKSISKNRAWLSVKDIILSIDKDDKGFRLIIWKPSGELNTSPIEFKSLEELEELVLDNPDLEILVKNTLKKLIPNWEQYYLKYSMGEIAQIMAMPEYRGIEPKVSSTDVLVKVTADIIKKNFKVAELVSDGVPVNLYCKEGVVWKPCRNKLESFIGSLGEIHGILGKKISKQFVERVLYHVGITSRREVEYKNYVAFGNKVLDLERFIETGSITDSFVDPEYVDVYYRIEHEIDVNALVKAAGIKAYIPPKNCGDLVELFKAIAPETYNYFKQLVSSSSGDGNVDSKVCFIAQLIGRMFYPGYRFKGVIAKELKNIFVLIGPPNTGKSTFIVNYVGEVILGKDNFKVGNISRLTSPRQADDILRELGDYYNVLMVVYPDVGRETRIDDWSTLTRITGGDPAKGRTLYENAFQYYPAYKFVITTNSPPPLPREEEIRRAILERMRIVEMKNTFNGVLDMKPLIEETTRSIIVYLYALRTIFTSGWAKTGILNIEDLWLRYQEPLYKLIVEMIETGMLRKCEGCEISTSELYSFIQEYITQKARCNEEECEVEEESMQILPKQDVFTKQLKTWAPILGIRLVKKKGYTYVKGLAVKPLNQKTLVLA